MDIICIGIEEEIVGLQLLQSKIIDRSPNNGSTRFRLL